MEFYFLEQIFLEIWFSRFSAVARYEYMNEYSERETELIQIHMLSSEQLKVNVK